MNNIRILMREVIRKQLHDVRNKHFVVSSMKDLFEHVASQNIVDFIKETVFISNFNVCVLMFVTSFYFILAK